MRFAASTLLLCTLLATIVSEPGTASAERILAPGAREKEATDIVVGKVSEVYEKKAPTERYGKGTVESRYLVEVQVERVEKGDLEKGRVLYVRAWKIAHTPGDSAVVGPTGHRSIPDVGDRIRAYVVRGPYKPTGQTDNGYTAVYPTGFEALDDEKE